jgi:hypothetical protein
LKFRKALPQQLRSQVEPTLFSESPGGVFSLDRAFEIAERIDLARAFSEGLEGAQEETVAQVAPVTRGVSTVVRGGAAAAVASGAQCFRCEEDDHVAAECPVSRTVKCELCGKHGHVKAACWGRNPSLKPEWLGKKMAAGPASDPRDAVIEELRKQVAELTQKMGELTKNRPRPGAPTAGGHGTHVMNGGNLATSLADCEVDE